MFDAIRTAIADAVRVAVREKLGAEIDRIALERPPKAALGDLASPVAFDLAKSLRKAPRAIAADLAAAISLPEGIREVRVEGAGYLNFFLDRGGFVRRLLGAAPASAPRPGKVIVEHTNINPNKAAHIGHLRNAVLGDVLVRTLRHLGHEVEVQNYLDDTGVQVADVRSLVRVDGGVLDDGFRAHLGTEHDLAGELREQIAATVEIEIEIPVRRGDHLGDAGHTAQRAGQLLGDRAGRLAQRPRQLKRDGDGQVAERAVGRHLDRKGRNLGKAVLPACRGGDVVPDFLMGAENHEC